MDNPFRSDFECLGSFCERPMEFSYLYSAAMNRMNVVLAGNRGQGRTSLVKKVLTEVAYEVAGIYIPCRRISLFSNETNIESELATALINGMLRACPESEGQVREKLIRYDPMMSTGNDGRIKIEFGSSSKLKISAVYELWESTLTEVEKTGLIVFDDFHLIAKEELEDSLRAAIQSTASVSHIFVISQVKGFERWFMSSERAFFRSGSQLVLQAISKNEWRTFLQQQFSSIGIEASGEMISEVLRVCNKQTAGVMEVCSILVELAQSRPIFPADVMRSVSILVRRHSVYLSAILDGLSRNQQNLLIALAMESEPVKPYANSFLNKYEVKSTSMQKALPVLLEKELVVENEDGTIRILDPIFRHFILGELRYEASGYDD